MARPPVFPAEEKVRIVLSILDAGMPTHEVLCGHRRARADLAPPHIPCGSRSPACSAIDQQFARQIGQQPEHEPANATAGLHPREPRSHPLEQPVGLSTPSPGIYAVARGHRLIFRSRHNGR
jgi:hypothetical protein